MSRRARNRADKRDIAIELARFCGHGTQLPSEDEPQESPGEPDDPWGWGDPQGPRTPIGPIDCGAPNSAR